MKLLKPYLDSKSIRKSSHVLSKTVYNKEQTFHTGHTEWSGPLHYKAPNMMDKSCARHKGHIP